MNASVAPIDTIAVDGNSVAVQKPTPAHGELGLDVDEYYSTMGPTSNDPGITMRNPVYAPPATVVGNSAYDTAGVAHPRQRVNSPATIRSLSLWLGILDARHIYPLLGVGVA